MTYPMSHVGAFMDRPSLHPSAFDDDDGAETSASQRMGVGRRLSDGATFINAILRRRLFVWRIPADATHPVTPWWLVCLRLLVCGGSAIVVVLAILAYGALRINAVPQQPPTVSDDIAARTISPGVWFYGQLTARRVLSGGADPLRRTTPLAIIVPDAHAALYESRELMAAAYKAGYLVALVDPLAGGDGFTRIGIGEASVVRQVRDQLLKRPDVDAGRVVLIGRGTGAIACLLAADGGSAPGRGLVLIDNPTGPEMWMQSQMPAVSRWVPGLIASKWLGEIALGFDADEAVGRSPSRAGRSESLLTVESAGCGSSRQVASRVGAFLRRLSAPVADNR